MLPNFFIAGAAKSGTTALYHYLDRHPEVYMSPIKEPNHFCTDIKPEFFSKEFRLHEKLKNIDLKTYLAGPMKEKHWGYFITQQEDYERLFKNVTHEKAIGEVSNSYLYSGEAAMNIRRTIPEARIIIMLRNPVLRAFSHYQANLRDGKTFLSFRREMERDLAVVPQGWGQSYLYIEMGYYFEQVKRYLDVFPEKQIKIFLYDDFVSDNRRTMYELCTFLGILPDETADYNSRYNEAMEPVNSRFLYLISRHGFKKRVFHALPVSMQKWAKSVFFRHKRTIFLSPEDRNYLTEIYMDDIMKLSRLIHRDLSSWYQ